MSVLSAVTSGAAFADVLYRSRFFSLAAAAEEKADADGRLRGSLPWPSAYPEPLVKRRFVADSALVCRLSTWRLGRR